MERLGMITSYVKEHYMEEICCRRSHGWVSLNPDYFTRFFKKYMGMTFLDYVNSVRMEHVKSERLAENRSECTEAAGDPWLHLIINYL